MIIRVVGLSLLISVVLLISTVRFEYGKGTTIVSWGIQNLRGNVAVGILAVITILASIGILSLIKSQ